MINILKFLLFFVVTLISGQNFVDNPVDFFSNYRNKSCDIIFDFKFEKDTVIDHKRVFKIFFQNIKPEGERQYLFFYIKDSILYTSKLSKNKIKLRKWFTYKKSDIRKNKRKNYIYLNNKKVKIIYNSSKNESENVYKFYNYYFRKTIYTERSKLYDKTISFDIITGFQMSLKSC